MELPEFLHDLTGGGDKPSLKYATEIFSMLEVVKVKKKEVILHLGEVCDNIYYIKSGIIKGSIIDEYGDMHAIRFTAENDVITSMYSFIDQTPSNIELQCVEAGEVMCFKYQDFEYINKLYPGLTPAFNKLMLKRYHKLLDEKSRMITYDATTRYLKFMERYSYMEERLPLKDIASYLGIRQQSLSRLRSKIDQEAYD
ncbi:Crp/Fnr family transcriptional regulator [Nonlabens marinus]|uniref:cAMP-binding proteins-catabolite gene activator and regulatory subunit of cAMP-dependent protein kinases n=1 Tax=Nonlabens marinus S1-08 TaxID=1454201 RepID=W8VNS3_9FLAO|nr:Crp/Fnr family transcriptional regulator [Nonlabens marinus]BAO54624.1 cAMP-binding proteins - catabolite gene activator and regulatory subunit of cAMP-dependent protein kinases [Nonlabens marinus S1-08]